MNRISFPFIFCLLLLGACGGKQQPYFNNPVIHGDMADPTIIRVGDTYYVTGTSSEWAPFYPVFVSKDLVNWKQTGHVFNTKPEWTSNSFWAPELYHHKNGKTYCYYTARRASDGISYIGVAVTDDPSKEFTDHGLLVEFGREAIDAFVFEDNGQLYITWKAYGLDDRPIELIGSRLSADGLQLEGEPFSLMIDDENIGMEGQYHFKQGDYYYIVYSARGCCGFGSNYEVRAARSKNLFGPYEKYAGNPILYGGDGDFMACGHGTAVETPDGRMFYFCHAYLKGSGFFGGRQSILQEMFVGDDHWVHFRTGDIAQVQQPMPFAGTVQRENRDFEDNFDKKTLKTGWAWNYPYANVKTEIKGKKLLLSSIPEEGKNAGAALCIRPQSPDYSYETLLSADKNESFKGLTMYGDNQNFVTWGSRGDWLVLQLVRNGKKTVLFEQLFTPAQVHLKIDVAEGCKLFFSWSEDGKNWSDANIDMDSAFLVRWDRMARPGIIHIGDAGSPPGEFSYFRAKAK